MHLTQETDYAMRIVFCLAKNDRRMDAASISEAMCVTLRFSLKILGKLAGAGLVNSYKGIKGGYELARPASQITLKQVVDAVEGKAYAISRCLDPENGCNRGVSGCCSFQKVWQEVTREVNARLSAVTFADMVADDAEREASGQQV
ncbi:Rrf2 family transcriptional regulator [Anaerofilum sp. BX8]|uniref:Rrf2 family transcriptional regulator n=1 Tax=Anaerofilum hominis TaxID=2763016 RepID=A0A923KXA4_9FIRM|nr:Rrf2 family transcriptional regulator [Anaerofilum hominis]MBC5580299.1 Rrf2 family transcriptional regulator [Anaerofilum hominis]